jgi:hypothetical protein
VLGPPETVAALHLSAQELVFDVAEAAVEHVAPATCVETVGFALKNVNQDINILLLDKLLPIWIFFSRIASENEFLGFNA